MEGRPCKTVCRPQTDPDAVVNSALRHDAKNRGEIERDYQEAAITVEERFRKEMGYQERKAVSSKGIGTESESYGTWPWHSKLKYGDYEFQDDCGISLMKSIFLWYDIQQNYERGIK